MGVLLTSKVLEIRGDGMVLRGKNLLKMVRLHGQSGVWLTIREGTEWYCLGVSFTGRLMQMIPGSGMGQSGKKLLNKRLNLNVEGNCGIKDSTPSPFFNINPATLVMLICRLIPDF